MLVPPYWTVAATKVDKVSVGMADATIAVRIGNAGSIAVHSSSSPSFGVSGAFSGPGWGSPYTTLKHVGCVMWWLTWERREFSFRLLAPKSVFQYILQRI